MRERKVRYWNSFNKEMDYEPTHYTFDGEHVNVNMLLNSVEEDGDEWSDWIGRQDDFGQDIYEGDIVEVTNMFSPNEFQPRVFTVEHDDKNVSFILRCPEFESETYFVQLNGYKIKVVGNRWEGLK